MLSDDKAANRYGSAQVSSVLPAAPDFDARKTEDTSALMIALHKEPNTHLHRRLIHLP
jgi:hypothetical protein